MLALVNFQIFPNHDHAVIARAGSRAIGKLRDVLLHQPDVLEFATFDDVLLHVPGTGARRSFHFIARLALKSLPLCFRDVFRHFVELSRGINTEYKAHIAIMPAIEVLGLTKVGIATKTHSSKTGANAQVDRLIKPMSGSLMAWAVAAAIHDVQRFVRIRQ